VNIQKLMASVDPTVADTHVPASEEGWVQTDKEGKAFMKVLWTDSATGEWAVLYRWKKGFVAPRHKHLGAIHAYIVSGRLRLRDVELGPGDYVHEANGMVHDETEALEDTLQLNIADGPLLFFSETEITGIAGWEQMRRIGERSRSAGASGAS
jgi:quercetin dioxygenase-like cupin family protein